ncbi:MAG: hypothetical protein AB7I18_13015 [Candidatus Berkiella sp.]
MRLINSCESSQVAGGALNAMGHSLHVDTSGIPRHCVRDIEAGYNAVFKAAENPNMSATTVLNAMGPHIDSLIASGCNNYLELYNSRLEALANSYA